MTQEAESRHVLFLGALIAMTICSVALLIAVATEDQARAPYTDTGSYYVQACIYEPENVVIVERKLFGLHAYFRYFKLPGWCECGKDILLPLWLDVNKEQESCTFRLDESAN